MKHLYPWRKLSGERISITHGTKLHGIATNFAKGGDVARGSELGAQHRVETRPFRLPPEHVTGAHVERVAQAGGTHGVPGQVPEQSSHRADPRRRAEKSATLRGGQTERVRVPRFQPIDIRARLR